MNKLKVSCIIPAHNEAPRIGSVLEVASNHPLIDEVIVVDDASTDGTAAVVKKFSHTKLIEHKINSGKSGAVSSGLRAAEGDIIFLLDADLIGLKPEDVADLIEPVASGRADISISLRGNSPWFSRMFGLDFISGERVFHKNLVSNQLDRIAKLTGFGLEVFMNQLLIKSRCKIMVVPWKNVESPYPNKKRGFFGGILAFAKMTLDIFKTVSPFGIVIQYIKMHRLIRRK